MKFIKTKIQEVVIIEPKVFGDKRGYFSETFSEKLFQENVIKTSFVQDNESKSKYGVLRGLHYQLPPFTQSKLVRVIDGKVLDVAVDIRKGSPTFGKHVAVELSSENKLQLFVPRGFAHGFAVLSKSAMIIYKIDNVYAPDYEAGIAYNDVSLAIDWKIPEDQLLLSEKDIQNPNLLNANLFNYPENLYNE